jgi:hypothetical protein
MTVNKKKTPAPRRAGTVTKARALREAAVISNLDWLQTNDPDRFAEAMRILAELVVSARPKKE